MSETLEGKIQAGDTVQIRRWTRAYVMPRQGGTVPATDGVEEVTVTRVGRTLAYITEYGREVGFYLADGRERGGRERGGRERGGRERGGKSPRRMVTPETLKAHLHRRDVLSAVSTATMGYGWAGRLTTEALEGILRTLENPEAQR